jgi:hypothetical protein
LRWVDKKGTPVKRTLSALLTCVTLAIGFTTTWPQDRNADLRSLIPPGTTLDGWSRRDTARIYAGDDLFSFIDGGAVLFFEYGFDRVLAAEYENKSGSAINLEIYRMKDDGAAYGIYSVRTGERGLATGIGQEGTRNTGYIMFWKGDCYVSVAGSDSTTECTKGMETIAATVAQALTRTGTKPVLLASLPQELLLKSWYVRGTLGFSTILPSIAEEMGGLVDGVVGKYEKNLLCRLRYANPAESERAMGRCLAMIKEGKRFSNYHSDSEIAFANGPDGRVFCLAQTGSHLLVTVSSDEAIAGSSIKSLLQWNRFR